MAAAALPAAAALEGGQKAAGLIKTFFEAMNHDVVSLHWERERDRWGKPRTDRKMVLTAVDVHITTGMILGVAALALLWEVGNWFAQALNKAGAIIPGVGDILGAGTWVVQDLEIPAIQLLFGGGRSLAPNGSATATAKNQKLLQIPSTFGAALNQTMRDFMVAGPAPIAQGLTSLVAKLTAATAPSSSS